MERLINVEELREHIGNRYNVRETLGPPEGGMTGQVFLAEQPSIRPMKRAIKVLKWELALDDDFVTSFNNEIEKMASVTHNNIVKIIDAGRFAYNDVNVPYFVMEYIDGSNDLGTYIGENLEQLRKDDIYRLLLELGQALEYLHSRDILHMDIKPHNILVADGSVKVLDLGFAKNIARPGSTKVYATEKYMDPRLLKIFHDQRLHTPDVKHIVINRKDLDPTYDLYSLGATLSEFREVFSQIMDEADYELLSIILRKLTRDLDDQRYRTAKEYITDVNKFHRLYIPTAGILELSPTVMKKTLRIPELLGAPLTDRVIALIDTPWFQRLRRVMQLGPTHLVYPGARHTRFEHSLGVYTYVTRYVGYLLHDPYFKQLVDEKDILTVLAAGLLHDIGQYPFAHIMEELDDFPLKHHVEISEDIILGRRYLEGRSGPQIPDILERKWGISPDRVASLVTGDFDSPNQVNHILRSIIDSTIDADRMDYLERDSVHSGVVYGRHFDRERMLSSLILDESKEGIALSEKGMVSAENFIFCRYSMFSEVYWHHAVRSATRMLQKAIENFFEEKEPLPERFLDAILSRSDGEAINYLYKQGGKRTKYLLKNLIRGRRGLYKRLRTYYYFIPEDTDLYKRILRIRARRNEFSRNLVAEMNQILGRAVSMSEDDLLVDIPDPDKDAMGPLQIYFKEAGKFIDIGVYSGMLSGVKEDFQKHVKKVRIFYNPRPKLKDALSNLKKGEIDKIVKEALKRTRRR